MMNTMCWIRDWKAATVADDDVAVGAGDRHPAASASRHATKQGSTAREIPAPDGARCPRSISVDRLVSAHLKADVGGVLGVILKVYR